MKFVSPEHEHENADKHNIRTVKNSKPRILPALDPQLFTSASKPSLKHCLSRSNIASQTSLVSSTVSPTRRVSKPKTTLRNSEGYVIYRSLRKPVRVKRVIHFERALESPLGEKDSNPTFTEKQVSKALEKKHELTANVHRSISPTRYDNRLGYTPRTINIFNLKKGRKMDQHLGKQRDTKELIKVNGKATFVDKDNIFKTLGKQPVRPYLPKK